MNHNSEIESLLAEISIADGVINDRKDALGALRAQLWRHRMGRAHMEGQLAAYMHVGRISPAMACIVGSKVADLKRKVGPI